MDLTSLIGLIIGLAGLILGFVLEEGKVGMLLKETAALIVFGGTIGAVTVSFSSEELKTIPYFLKVVFTNKKIEFGETIDQLVQVADKARREGLLSLETQLEELENEFMRRALQLVIDGTDPELTRNMLEMEIEAFEKRQKLGVDIFNAAGGFAPTMGIIGTVMGLVQVLSNVSEPDKLGGAIAVAFIATLYGIFSANILWIPFAGKIKVKTEKEVKLMELVLEGVLSVQAGENPRVIREKLMTFLAPAEKQAMFEAQKAGVEM
ncbi:MAG TPA: flagellar motor protein [Syntrophothermus lipocalidus]|uniref:MotA/TolQ/ExbB proton channel n=1 Tax=Syntrophothermus lipocalidus (strain DSM 12680 / TGB-C1) TaxID=643648 RepID=D7CPJ6_SYNLT|nr:MULTISPECIES: flagellar motor protein [Syntrophothermus]ADI02631.1 MotA/TolQ/ExbB proton channel [Syntrophothermus lipocalidus DSM 12680]NSW83946.1 flagellar motor protein [Syntrophothermus sp.]HHV76144.1 flagellar motor protein [Syntrophothermus lipocalidus]HOV43730.1 flagellar motor protein [Syntrophothermus lipocalidus]